MAAFPPPPPSLADQSTREADAGAHFLKHHVVGATTFTVLADRSATPGTQLFEDYGDNDNRMCGFSLPLCPLPPLCFIPLILCDVILQIRASPWICGFG